MVICCSRSAAVALPACASSGDAQVDYLWSLYNADGTTASVNLKNTQLPRLIIPRAALEGGKTYKARVDVTMRVDASKTTYDEAEIVVKSSKLRPKITGQQTVGYDGTVKLSGKRSRDPDNAKYVTPIYQWRILTSDGGPVIKNRMNIMDGIVLNTRDISFKASDYLEVEQEYKAELVYRVGTREETAEFKFRVEAGSPPKVEIKELTEPQDPAKKVRLLAQITSVSKLIADPDWTSTNGAEGRVRGGKKKSLYVIDANTLNEASTYDYTVEVSNGATAASSVTFTTNSKPVSGKWLFLLSFISVSLSLCS